MAEAGAATRGSDAVRDCVKVAAVARSLAVGAPVFAQAGGALQR